MSDKRFYLAITAAMERHATEIKNIGKTVKVSEMELITLVNFAEIGLMSLFVELDGETGVSAEGELQRQLDAIRDAFKSNKEDGLTRLSKSAAAILRGRFQKYLAKHNSEGGAAC